MSEFDDEQVAPAVEPEAPAEEPETPIAAVEPEVVYVSEPDPAPAPAPVVEAKSKNDVQAASFERVVLMSSLKYQSLGKRSLSVAYVQERLIELGFFEAGADKRGWLSEGTKSSLEAFAKSDVIKSGAVEDMSVIQNLFSGTSVKVLP